MKNKASHARKMRLAAAKRLIEQHSPPVTITPKKPKGKVLRMVEPVEVRVKVVGV